MPLAFPRALARGGTRKVSKAQHTRTPHCLSPGPASNANHTFHLPLKCLTPKLSKNVRP